MVFAEPYLWAVALAVGWLTLVGWPIVARDDRPLSAIEVGYLRRGERGAISTAAFLLLSLDLVRVTRKGALARSGAPIRSGLDPFAAAVYAAMPRPTGLRAMSAKPRVRAAVRALVGGLAAAGLVPGRVRWLLSRLTLIAIAVTGAVGLAQPDGGPAERISYAGVLLLAAGAWPVRRRTVAGYRRLRAVRRQVASAATQPAGVQPVPAEPDAVTAFASSRINIPGIEDAYARSYRAVRDGSSLRDWLDGHGFGGGSGGSVDAGSSGGVDSGQPP
jgi:uncharacterized protein (TIGR04222 family)